MNIIKLHKTFGSFAAAIFVATFAPHANAGSGPEKVYRPVTTAKQAATIPIGQTIAFSCGNCNGVTTTTVDKAQSHLKGFTCPSCKTKFRVTKPTDRSTPDAYELADSYRKLARLSFGGG